MGDLDSRLATLQDESSHLSDEIDNKKKEMWENGGARLEGARKDLAGYEKDLKIVSQKAEEYRVLADALGLALPSSLDEFIKDGRSCRTWRISWRRSMTVWMQRNRLRTAKKEKSLKKSARTAWNWNL